MNTPEPENGTYRELEQTKISSLQDFHNSQVFGKSHGESGNLDKIEISSLVTKSGTMNKDLPA
jgi:hypothetical protein